MLSYYTQYNVSVVTYCGRQHYSELVSVGTSMQVCKMVAVPNHIPYTYTNVSPDLYLTNSEKEVILDHILVYLVYRVYSNKTQQNSWLTLALTSGMNCGKLCMGKTDLLPMVEIDSAGSFLLP